MYKRYSQQELCDAIYRIIFDSKRPLTRYEITYLLGRKKSPHIVAMIESLVAGGWFIKEEFIGRNKQPVYAYSLNKNKLPNGVACPEDSEQPEAG